jgi:transcriptional regulator with XRE-family HTH domain
MSLVEDNGDNTAATHFGRQMRKERLAHGWSLRKMAAETGIDIGQLSRVETGKRPPSRKLAGKCDEVFPQRRGWFTDWLDESRKWAEVPASFRSWPDYEDRAASLRDWSPSIVTGLLQVEGYARALLETSVGVTPELVTTRLAARMDRQHRILGRTDHPSAFFLVDEMALYRDIGGPDVMVGQLRHLAEVATMPRVIVQVLPAVAHPVNASGFLLADDAAWIEHTVSGYVFTDPKTVTGLALRFDTLRAESFRASETRALLERTAALWATGVSPLTAMRTAGTA